MHLPRTILVTARAVIVALIGTVPAVPSKATTGMKNRFTVSRTGQTDVLWCGFRDQKGNSGQSSAIKLAASTHRVEKSDEKICIDLHALAASARCSAGLLASAAGHPIGPGPEIDGASQLYWWNRWGQSGGGGHAGPRRELVRYRARWWPWLWDGL